MKPKHAYMQVSAQHERREQSGFVVESMSERQDELATVYLIEAEKRVPIPDEHLTVQYC